MEENIIIETGVEGEVKPAEGATEVAAEPVLDPIAEAIREVVAEATEPVAEAEPVAETEPVADATESEPALEAEVADETEAPDEDSEEIKELIATVTAHFTNIRNLLKYNKDKDGNVTKLTAELQAYRDGIGSKALKSIALMLISMREDAKKSIQEFSERGLEVDAAKKYLNYIVYDYEDLLTNLNIRVEDGNIFYNNLPVKAGFDKKIAVCEFEEFMLPEAPELASHSLSDIIEYLNASEVYMREVLKANAQLDKLLKICIENSALYEQGIHQVILYPAVTMIGTLYGKVVKAVNESLEALSGGNTVTSYVACAGMLIEELDQILGVCGVTIDEYVSDTYDVKRHRLLKTVPTDVEADNGKIAVKYCACYTMDERVIYPQKVDVLKYQAKTN